ncbi:hypothetical protein Taro_019484 [Colocasia esculenta]|uniref:Uncharacterized protein n=1 Tax=Colocasia esculenta TaxID=4460 RepID=A0A843UTW3_COLES|nr:hypothetical protein [Colocasia esculenta]
MGSSLPKKPVGLTMVPESDWKLFCQEWDVAEDKGILSEIVFAKGVTSKLVGSCEEVPMVEEDLNSSHDTVVELEAKDLMVKTDPDVVKENQKLHKGSVEIEDDSATLADKNIFPGDVLWVTDSEIHENRDIADELSEQKDETREAEEGFRGTLLTSGVSFQERHDPTVSS